MEHIRSDLEKTRRIGSVGHWRASGVGFVRGFRTDGREAYVFFGWTGKLLHYDVLARLAPCS